MVRITSLFLNGSTWPLILPDLFLIYAFLLFPRPEHGTDSSWQLPVPWFYYTMLKFKLNKVTGVCLKIFSAVVP